jgi:hypothetical protein
VPGGIEFAHLTQQAHIRTIRAQENDRRQVPDSLYDGIRARHGIDGKAQDAVAALRNWIAHLLLSKVRRCAVPPQIGSARNGGVDAPRGREKLYLTIRNSSEQTDLTRALPSGVNGGYQPSSRIGIPVNR